MPGLDRGGPKGAGPMTGGKRGLCNRSGDAAGQPEYGGYGYGRGRGFGGGVGRGFCPGRGRGRSFRGRSWGDPPALPADVSAGQSEKLDMLLAEVDAMRKSLGAVWKRFEEQGRGKLSE